MIQGISMNAACLAGALAGAFLTVASPAARGAVADAASPAAGVGAPFSSATITEVVNDVKVLPDAASAGVPAKKDAVFSTPDLMQTERKSRAQLTAGDGTIVRVGSNTIFSFKQNSRTINLSQGSVLFNSPPGKGGGEIVTNSASATVTGTTLIVAATADGGFKVLMLEGTGSIKLPNGQMVTLTAGQELFVLPGATLPDGTKGPPRVGPVVNFDLKAQTQNSDLVNGFTVVLPSQSRIEDAVNAQQVQIAGGQFTRTDKAVIGAASENQIVVVDSSTLNTALDANNNGGSSGNITPPPPGPVDIALGTDLPLGTGAPPVPKFLIFKAPITFTAADLGLPNGLIANDQLVITGIIAGAVTARGPVDLSFLDGLTEADIFASNGMTFTDSTTFNGLNSTRDLEIFAEEIVYNAPASGSPLSVMANFGAGAATAFRLNAISGQSLSNVYVGNPTGLVALTTVLGTLSLSSTSVVAGAGDVLLYTGVGDLSVAGNSYLSATGGSVLVDSGGALAVKDSVLQATVDPNAPGTTGQVSLSSVSKMTVENGALIGNSISLTAQDDMKVNNVNFAAATAISMSARTLNIYNVNFPGASIVNLSSDMGLLAPRPNTNQNPQSGYVNFISNVNYNGQPAQKFVPITKGGTGEMPTRINIQAR